MWPSGDVSATYVPTPSTGTVTISGSSGAVLLVNTMYVDTTAAMMDVVTVNAFSAADVDSILDSISLAPASTVTVYTINVATFGGSASRMWTVECDLPTVMFEATVSATTSPGDNVPVTVGIAACGLPDRELRVTVSVTDGVLSFANFSALGTTVVAGGGSFVGGGDGSSTVTFTGPISLWPLVSDDLGVRPSSLTSSVTVSTSEGSAPTHDTSVTMPIALPPANFTADLPTSEDAPMVTGILTSTTFASSLGSNIVYTPSFAVPVGQICLSLSNANIASVFDSGSLVVTPSLCAANITVMGDISHLSNVITSLYLMPPADWYGTVDVGIYILADSTVAVDTVVPVLVYPVNDVPVLTVIANSTICHAVDTSGVGPSLFVTASADDSHDTVNAATVVDVRVIVYGATAMPVFIPGGAGVGYLSSPPNVADALLSNVPIAEFEAVMMSLTIVPNAIGSLAEDITVGVTVTDLLLSVERNFTVTVPPLLEVSTSLAGGATQWTVNEDDRTAAGELIIEAGPYHDTFPGVISSTVSVESSLCWRRVAHCMHGKLCSGRGLRGIHGTDGQPVVFR